MPSLTVWQALRGEFLFSRTCCWQHCRAWFEWVHFDFNLAQLENFFTSELTDKCAFLWPQPQLQSQSQLSWVFLYVFNALNILTFFWTFRTRESSVESGVHRDAPLGGLHLLQGVNGFVNVFFLFFRWHIKVNLFTYFWHPFEIFLEVNPINANTGSQGDCPGVLCVLPSVGEWENVALWRLLKFEKSAKRRNN